MSRVIKPDSGQTLEIQDEGGSAALTIETAGDVTVDAGNLVIGTAGKGIDFSNQASPAAGMTSELLDSYEEGTWPVTLEDAVSGGHASASTVNGTYVKIGSLCFVKFAIWGVTQDSCTGANPIFIHGLPFSSSGRSYGNYYTYRTGGGTLHHSSVGTADGTTYMRIHEGTGTSSDTDNWFTWNDIVSGTSSLSVSVVYAV